MPISKLNMGVSAAHQWQHSWDGYVMKDLEYTGIMLQAQPSSLRCVAEMKDQRQTLPPACLCFAAGSAAKEMARFISGRIKWGLRINKCLNSQHHLHKKQLAGYVGGPLYISLSVHTEGGAWYERAWRDKDNAVWKTFSVFADIRLQRCCKGTNKVWVFKIIFLMWLQHFFDNILLWRNMS